MNSFRIIKGFYILITLLIAWNSTFGQNRNLMFRNISKNQGLSNIFVNAILQDKQGFLWVGTWNGLNRYDGNKFKVYKSVENDSTTLFSDGIMRLAEDNNGRIWIICHTGLSMYDKTKDRFVRICPNDFSTGNYFTSLLVDLKGILWIGTYNEGIWTLPVNDSTDFSKIKPHFKRYKHDNNNPKSISTNFISYIYEDRKSNIWITTDNKIFDRYNPHADNFDHYSINIPGIEKQTGILTLQLEDSDGLYWFGSSGAGLISWDKERNVFKQYLNNANKISLSANIVTHIRQAKDGILWISTDGGGISFYDKKTGLFDYCKNETTNPNSISSNAVNLTFEDRSGIIWICTYNMGLNKFETTNTNFRHVKPNPFDKNSLSHISVTSILEDTDGNFWIGTDGGGLNFWNNRTKNFRHFFHDPSNPNSISGNVVISLAEDFEGNIWVGTYTKGLNCYKRKEDTFIRYTNIPGDNYSLSHNNVWTLVEDNKHNLWIGTLEGTLNLFERKTNRFYSYKNNPNDSGSFVGAYTTDLFEDSRHCLWIATSAGLEMVELDNYDFKKSLPKLHFNHYRHDTLMNSISTNNISCIYEDHDRNMWFGANSGGLNKLNTKTDEFTHFTETDGLPDNTIRGILEDHDNNIWASTEKGISKFDPNRKVFRAYDISNDLHDYSFSNARCQSKDGRLFFGGPNGFIVFNPKSITTNNTPPHVVLTDFKIYNSSVAVGQKINGNIVLTQSITESKVLTLSHEENFFSFEFSALDFTNPEKNRYAYTLEGFDNKWHTSDAKNRIATYTNLDAGRYTFRVKASNNDGVWNEEGIALTIIILPPWWQTLWFRLVLLAVFLGITYWIYTWRVQARDIAAGKQMEAALTKERNLLRTLIDNLPDAVFVKDLECRKIIANPVDVRAMGAHSEAEVIGKTYDTFSSAETAATSFAEDQSVIQSGKSILGREGSYFNQQGNKVNVLSFKIPLRNEHGNIVGIVGVTQDITERKRAEEALQESEERYRRLVDFSPDAIAVHSEGVFVYLNPAAVKLIGANYASQLIGTSALKVVHPEDRDFVRQRTEAGLKDGKPLPILEEKFIKMDGTAIDVEVAAIPITYRGTSAMQIIIRDITERKKMQSQFAQTQKVQSIGTLAGGIAHDFNNLLGIILAYSSVLERVGNSNQKKFAESIKAINSAVNRGAALVRQILMFARQTDIAIKPMSVPELIHEVVNMLQATFPKVIEFKEIFERGVPFIQADQSQIHQAVLNLCVNARDAMPNGGIITITVETTEKEKVVRQFPGATFDRYLILSVSDTGTGMDETTKSRIFDPFFTTKELGKGTGLGLSVVYGIIQSHYGFLSLDSEVGKGSTFHLYFPIPQEYKKVHLEQAKKSIETSGGTEAILFIEDEELLRSVVVPMLESSGYTVHVAVDGQQAIDVYKQHQNEISLVLTDIGLPKQTGVDVFLQLRKLNPKVKIILASGFISLDQRSELLKAGAIDFIQKPYVLDDVLQKIREVLDEK